MFAVVGTESHPVRRAGKNVLLAELQVIFVIELDLVSPQQLDALLFDDSVDSQADGRGINGVWFFPAQSHQDGGICSVALAGMGQRTIQNDFD